jgi:hypothetical protein
MAIFMVVPTSEGKIATKLQETLPGKFYLLPKGEFLVQYAGTSKDLSDFLGITDGANGAAVVASLSGYFGRAPTDIWEWMKQHWSEA